MAVMVSRMRIAAVVLGATLVSSCGDRREVVVFAAASLGPAVERIFQGREEVTISLGASSALARQILAGAPADLFLSADRRWADAVAYVPGVTVADRREVIGNDVVVAVPQRFGAPLAGIADLAGPAVARVATADPTLVPLGRHARRGLERLGLWEAVAPKLLTAEDARVALLYVQRGEADCGILYASDVAGVPELVVVGRLPLVGEDAVVYPFLLLGREGGPPKEAAREAHQLILSEQSAAVFRDCGFRVLADAASGQGDTSP